VPEYLLAARLFVAGQGAQLYKPEQLRAIRKQMFPEMRERGFGVLNPPPALPILAPLAPLPLSVMKVVWPCLLAASAIGRYFACLKVYGSFGYVGNLSWWMGLVLCGPLAESLRIGQMAPLFLLALVIWAWALKQGKTLPAAVALAFFVLKPQLAIPLGLFVV